MAPQGALPERWKKLDGSEHKLAQELVSSHLQPNLSGMESNMLQDCWVTLLTRRNGFAGLFRVTGVFDRGEWFQRVN